MKKLIAFILVITTLVLTLTGCSFLKYSNGVKYKRLTPTENTDINSKVESNDFVFNKNDVTLDFYYSLYSLDDVTLEEAKANHTYVPTNESESNRHKEFTYAIYLSNNAELMFETDDQDYIVDHKNKVNAQIYKFISFEEAFSKNYGYTSSELKITYNHNEKLTIPTELFNSSNGCVYIHIVTIIHNPSENTNYFSKYSSYALGIKYLLIGDKVALH